jgi:hypothetical protein
MNTIRRIVSIALGLFFTFQSIASYRERSVYVHSRFSESTVVEAAKDPSTFWMGIFGFAVMAVLCFYYGFRKSKDEG